MDKAVEELWTDAKRKFPNFFYELNERSFWGNGREIPLDHIYYDYRKLDKILETYLGFDELHIEALKVRTDLSLSEKSRTDLTGGLSQISETSERIRDRQKEYLNWIHPAFRKDNEELLAGVAALSPLQDRLFEAALEVSPEFAVGIIANMLKDSDHQISAVQKWLRLIAKQEPDVAESLLRGQVDRHETYYNAELVYGPVVRQILQEEIKGFSITRSIGREMDQLAHALHIGTHFDRQPSSVASQIFARRHVINPIMPAP